MSRSFNNEKSFNSPLPNFSSRPIEIDLVNQIPQSHFDQFVNIIQSTRTSQNSHNVLKRTKYWSSERHDDELMNPDQNPFQNEDQLDDHSRELPLAKSKNQECETPFDVIDYNHVSNVPILSNDCEIIVYGDYLTNYAEKIERELKKYLKIDIMYPKFEAKLNTILERIKKNGTSFAICLRPDNLVKESASVFILNRNKIEEHRNMPIISALRMIKRKYVEINQPTSNTESQDSSEPEGRTETTCVRNHVDKIGDSREPGTSRVSRSNVKDIVEIPNQLPSWKSNDKFQHSQPIGEFLSRIEVPGVPNLLNSSTEQKSFNYRSPQEILEGMNSSIAKANQFQESYRNNPYGHQENPNDLKRKFMDEIDILFQQQQELRAKYLAADNSFQQASSHYDSNQFMDSSMPNQEYDYDFYDSYHARHQSPNYSANSCETDACNFSEDNWNYSQKPQRVTRPNSKIQKFPNNERTPYSTSSQKAPNKEPPAFHEKFSCPLGPRVVAGNPPSYGPLIKSQMNRLEREIINSVQQDKNIRKHCYKNDPHLRFRDWRMPYYPRVPISSRKIPGTTSYRPMNHAEKEAYNNNPINEPKEIEVNGVRLPVFGPMTRTLHRRFIREFKPKEIMQEKQKKQKRKMKIFFKKKDDEFVQRKLLYSQIPEIVRLRGDSTKQELLEKLDKGEINLHLVKNIFIRHLNNHS